MSIEEIGSEALRLDPKPRAHMAQRLLESLESSSEEQNDKLWVEEAERRDRDWNSVMTTARPATDVVRRTRDTLG